MDPRLVRAFEKGESVDFDEVMGMDAEVTTAAGGGGMTPSSSAAGGDDDNNSSNGNNCRPPRVKVSPFTSSARIEEKMLEDEHDRIAKLEEAVRELLDLCARYVGLASERCEYLEISEEV
jgi:hypothetical protein